MSLCLERDDDCGKVYRKSLLYLICNASEAERGTPILGLEASLRSDPDLKKLFGLDGTSSNVGEVMWSKTASDVGRSASRSTTHGGFDNDRATMNSVARRVLDLSDTDVLEKEFPEEATRSLRDIWSQPMEWPEELSFLTHRPMFPAGDLIPIAQGPAGSAMGGTMSSTCRRGGMAGQTVCALYRDRSVCDRAPRRMCGGCAGMGAVA